MEPVVGRTVSQIKNRYYQNLKDKDISKIKYKADEESAGMSPGELKSDESENEEMINKRTLK